MKIVFLSNADSFWIKEYIDRIFGDGNYEIYIITHKNEKYKEYYKKKHIIVYEMERFFNLRFPHSVINQKILFINSIVNELGRDYIIHIQYLDIYLLGLCKNIWKKASKRYITFWGSDLLRASSQFLNMYKPFLRDATEIQVLTRNMNNYFLHIYKNIYSEKIQVQDFGCPLYETIKQASKDFDNRTSKRYWGIEEEQITIGIGYNAKKQQQHIRVIEAISKLPKEIMDKITLILHFGYGDFEEDYNKQVIMTLNEKKFKYVIIDKFLDKRNTGVLRIAMDIFINAQTTDALSASVLEYLYAGTLLISGAWLDYPELDDNQISYVKFSEMNELPQIITKAVSTGLIEKSKIAENRDRLWLMNSWSVLIPKWKRLYEVK